MVRTIGRSRRRLDRLEVRVLERAAHDAHAVDPLALARRAARRCAGTSSRPASGNRRVAAVESRSPRRRAPRELVGAPSAIVRPRSMIDDAVADELDLAEQVRVQQHRDAAPAQLLEQAADGAPAGGIERARGLVEQERARGVADRAPARSRAAAACPSTSPRRGRAVASARPTSSSSSARSAAPPPEPREALVQLEQLVGGRPAGEAEQLGEVAGRGACVLAAGRWPHAIAVPSVGRTSPQAIFVSVDLPAPLGPSRPTSSPSPTSQVDARRSASVRP